MIISPPKHNQKRRIVRGLAYLFRLPIDGSSEQVVVLVSKQAHAKLVFDALHPFSAVPFNPRRGKRVVASFTRV